MKIDVHKIPKHDADRIARSFLAFAAKAFEDPKIQAEFAEWQAKRAKEAVASGAS